jgi:hypothetical protein
VSPEAPWSVGRPAPYGRLLSRTQQSRHLRRLDDPRIRKIFLYDAAGRITGFIERRETWDIVWDKVG